MVPHDKDVARRMQRMVRKRDGRVGAEGQRHGQYAVIGVAGSRVAVVGPSGADVTAVLGAVAGLLPAGAGSVAIDGALVGTGGATPHQLGYLSQYHRLVGTMTAVESLMAADEETLLAHCDQVVELG